MTKGKKFKAAVRRRAARNNESYTSARQHEGGKPTGASVDGNGEKLITITMSESRWIVALGALDLLVPHALRGIDELKQKGIKPEDVPREQAIALGGPVVVRGILVKELAAHGIMTPEANEKLGIDALLARLRAHMPPDSGS